MKTMLLFGFLVVVIFSSPSFAESINKELYEKFCKTCHGVDGKGNDKLAKGMKIKRELLDLTKQETKNKKDDELKVSVADGTGKMKGLKNKLKADEISLIVAHIRTLQEAAK